MPIQDFTQDEINEMLAKGIDPNTAELAPTNSLTPTGMSPTGAALATLKGHAGSTLLGGGGALAGGEAGMYLGALGGPAAPLTVPLGGILGAIAGGLGGGYVGDKAQKAVLSKAYEDYLEQQAQQAQTEHPYISTGTDIASSALASGGMLSPTTAVKGIRGLVTGSLTPEAKNVALQALVNPAINTGLQYSQTGELPSASELGEQALGGALFAKPSFLGNRFGRPKIEPPQVEPTPEPIALEQPAEASGLPSSVEQSSPWMDKDEQGKYKLDNQAVGVALKAAYPKPTTQGDPTDPAFLEQMTKWRQTTRQPIDDLRQLLHKKFVDEQSAPKPEPTPEVTEKEQPPLKMVTTKQILPKNTLAEPVAELQKKEDVAKEETVEAQPLKDGENSKEETQEDLQKQLAQEMGYQSQATGPSDDKARFDEINRLRNQMHSNGSYLDSTGNFTPKYMELWKEAEKIKNKNKGMPPVQSATQDKLSEPVQQMRQSYGTEATPEHIVNHIFSGKATTGSVMKEFANAQGHPMQELAKALYMHMDKDSRAVKWDTSMKERSAYYPPGGNVTGDTVQMALLQNHHAPTVMEEAIHSMTSAKLPREWHGLRGKALSNAMDDFTLQHSNHPITELIHSYYSTAKALNISKLLFEGGSIKKERAEELTNKGINVKELEKGVGGNPDTLASINQPYAMGDLHEFIAHAFMDKEFQETLNKIHSPTGLTIWQRFINAIGKLLGVPVNQHSMLDRVIRHSSELISQPRSRENSHLDMDNPHFAPPSKTTKSEEPGRVRKTFQSLIDSVKQIPRPEGKLLGEAFQKMYNDKQLKTGRWANEVQRVADEHHITGDDIKAIGKQQEYDRLNKSYSHKLLTTKGQKAVYDKMLEANKAIITERIKINEPVIENGKPRVTKEVDGYWPTTAKQSVTQIYRNNTDFAAIAKLDKDFLDNRILHGESSQRAQQALEDFKTSMQGSTRNSQVSNHQFFKANRAPHGIPLPESFREPNALKNWERYAKRSALDTAHYKNIESDHKVLSALGEQQDPWLNPVPKTPDGGVANNANVRNVLNTIHGEIGNPADYNEHAISHLTTSLFIASPALEGHKLISNILPGFASDAENPYQYTRALAYGLKNIKAGYQHASEGGLSKLTAKSTSDMLNGQLTAAERLQGLAKGVQNIASLGDLTNKWGSGLLQSMYEYIVPSKIQRANAGDKVQQDWLKNIDPSYKYGKQYSTKEIQQLSSLAASYVHGTGDARQLPGWMLRDSEVSGFMSLAHWSVAQTNRFYKNILDPAKKGDIGPLMTSLFGAAIGGYMVKKIREELSGKKSAIPSLSEIANSDRGIEGNMGLIGYNLVAAAQYSGFAGILAQVAKYPFDWSYKTMSQGATFPLDELAGDLAETLGQVATTIANDPNVNYISLAQAVSQHLLTHSFQLGRMGVNQAIDHGLITGLPAEKKELSDNLAKLRRFDMVEGLPYNEIEQGSNPYMNLEQKKFKSTQDIGEAMKALPGLVSNIMTTYSKTPDIMIEKLKALKQNQYSTFPSIEHMPIEFMKYMSYLQKEEGPEVAQAELASYMKHKMINSVKAAAVP